MPGIKCLYISKDNEIYKISIPNSNLYKPVPILANQEVLFTLLYYETINIIPSKLIYSNFDRILLDNNGGYELTIDEIKKCYIQSCIYNDLEFRKLVKKASILGHTDLKKSVY